MVCYTSIFILRVYSKVKIIEFSNFLNFALHFLFIKNKKQI